jgi:hypothetical protein
MRRSAVIAFLSLGAATSLFGAEPLTAAAAAKKNPFKPAGAAAGPAPTTHESIEFAGVSQIGSSTTLIFHDKTAKKNRWVGLNETVEGITVLRYDPRVEQVTVKINGAEKTLALRKGTGPVNAPTPVTPLPPAAGFATPLPAPPPTVAPGVAPVAPAPDATGVAPANVAINEPPKPAPAPGTPEAQVKAETDARMLVSDLLEIGMAQRRAYEEAQRRAAEGKTDQPAPAPATP